MPPGPASSKSAFANRPAGGSPSLPAEGSELAFARLVAILRGHPTLHGWTIRAWDDPSEDATPPATDGPPWARLTPSPGPSRIHSRGRHGVVHRMPLLITIEASTPGSQVRQSQRAWGAILRAFYPGEFAGVGGLDPELARLGVSRLEVTQPGWGVPPARPDQDPAPTDRCEGVGRIELTMHFTTPGAGR